MSENNYGRYLVRQPFTKGATGAQNQRYSALTLMSSYQVPESYCNIEFGWVGAPSQTSSHESEHVSELDEIMLFIGGDPENPEGLGGEMEFSLGGQKLSFNTSSSIFIPAGVRHGRLIRRKVTRPYVEISVMMGRSAAEPNSPESGISAAAAEPGQPGVDYEKYLVRKPNYETMTNVKNRQCPTMTFISGKQVPEAKCYIEIGWLYGMPEPNHIFEHVHKFEEAIIHWGSDPENPLDLGAEIELGIGGQSQTFNTLTAAWVPRGIMHGPLVWKQVTRPHVEMTFIIGTGSMKEAWGGSGIGGPKQREIKD